MNTNLNLRVSVESQQSQQSGVSLLTLIAQPIVSPKVT